MTLRQLLQALDPVGLTTDLPAGVPSLDYEVVIETTHDGSFDAASVEFDLDLGVVRVATEPTRRVM